MTAENPVFSFVTSARNDAYRGNFRWRLETTLNFIGREAAKTGRSGELEFVVVDWGSVVPLHSVLRLGEEARKIARFILVPPGDAARYDRGGQFAGSLAINAGVRRCRGRYVAQTGGDVLYDARFLSRLLECSFEKNARKFPPDRTLFLLSCRNVPEDSIRQCPGLGDLSVFIERNQVQFKVQPLIPFLRGGAAALLMHRELWDEMRGLDEEWFGWGWTDVDLNLRVGLKYQTVDYGTEEDLYGFHLDHPGSAVPHPYKFNPFVVNGAGWGLAGHRLEEFPPSDPVDVPSAPAGTGEFPENLHPWRRHFLNLLKFLVTCRDRRSLMAGYFALNAMILGLPEGNPIRRVYRGLKRAKDIIVGA